MTNLKISSLNIAPEQPKNNSVTVTQLTDQEAKKIHGGSVFLTPDAEALETYLRQNR
ncbi:MAG: hypothetical protein AB4426_10600 [Xenococcaceae cyanobacterium]